MKLFPILATSTIGLCASAAAQTATFSPLRSYATIEGNGHTSAFGQQRMFRMQLADGSLRGSSQTIKSVAMRPDYRRHTRRESIGRTWSRVTLHASEFDMATMKQDPGANIRGTPTLVFSGQVRWPTLDAVPLTRPAAASVRFPFRTQWVYSGKSADMLFDYRFDGGVLANNHAWPPFNNYDYALDSYGYGTWIQGIGAAHGNIVGGCGDSRNGTYSTASAATELVFKHYGPKYSIASYRNKVMAYYMSIYVGQRTTCVTSIGLKIAYPSITIPGTTCNELHVDLSGPTYFATNTSDSNTRFGYLIRYLSGPAPHLVKVPTAAIGVLLIAQTAWRDTGSGQFKLTTAHSNAIPPIPLWATPSEVPRKAVLEYSTSAGIKRFGPLQTSFYNPILRYGH